MRGTEEVVGEQLLGTEKITLTNERRGTEEAVGEQLLDTEKRTLTNERH